MIINRSDLLIDYDLPDGSTGSKGYSSNDVTSQLITDTISIIKSCNKTFLEENQKAIFTVEIENTSETNLTNVVFKDIMTGEATYVANSVIVDGVSQPSYDPKEGFTIPQINAKSTVVIEYTILSGRRNGSDVITNQANIKYNVEDPTQGTLTFEADSNQLEIKYIYVEAQVYKQVDKKYVKSGDILTYTIQVTDVSNYYENKYLLLQDQIPAGTTLIDNSLKVNGTTISGDISQGIYLTQYMTSGRATVEFKVSVN